MKTEKGNTTDGPFIKFEDNFGIPCKISKEWGRLRFMPYSNRNLPEYTAFSQEDIKSLLPYLQAYAETGTLEPTPTLQGESLLETAIKKVASLIRQSEEQEKQNESLVKERNYYMRQCDQYVDQVADLEDLLEKWRDIIERGKSNSSLNELQERTIQLLGE